MTQPLGRGSSEDLRGLSHFVAGFSIQSMSSGSREERVAQALNRHADGLLLHGQYDAACNCFSRALALNPQSAKIRTNLAAALFGKGDAVEATEHYRHVLRDFPADIDTLYNLGNALLKQGDVAGGVAHFERALNLKPDHAEAIMGLAMVELLCGDFANGWEHYESRFNLRAWKRRDFKEPLWRGEPFCGERILLHSEQGLGDTIQFLRYVPMVAARGGTVVLEVQPELKQIVLGIPGVTELRTVADPPCDVSLQCPLMSLPLLFETRTGSVPEVVPLHIGNLPMARWKEQVGAFEGFKVGVCWAGHPLNRLDRYRSLPFGMLDPLGKLKGLKWFSLQKGPAMSQIAKAEFDIENIELRCEQLADSAAVIASLDLVITVDTMIAHLAGTLGVPVWIMLAHVPDFRWRLGCRRSAWYPSARLFRQSGFGDWRSVIEEVGAALQVATANRSE